MPSRYVEGQAIVASPYLVDHHFLRTVVYIVRHDKEGAYGFVLNRPTDITVGQLLRQIVDEEVDNRDPIYHGGPVEGPVVVVHEHSEQEDTLYKPGVYLTADQDDVATVLKQMSSRYRVFTGYAGWKPRQLEEELKQGEWLVWDLSRDDIFDAPEEIWRRAIRQIGREILVESLEVSHIPDDPTHN